MEYIQVIERLKDLMLQPTKVVIMRVIVPCDVLKANIISTYNNGQRNDGISDKWSIKHIP